MTSAPTRGDVLAWGDNTIGQLGNGAAVDSDTPVRVLVPPGLTVSAIGAGLSALHSLAIVHRVRK